MKTLTDEERKAIVALRLEHAMTAIVEAKDTANLGHWRVTANRLYYACYYAASALLIKHGHGAHTHAGVITMLGQHFVKNGIISKEWARFYGQLFEMRMTGDYSDWIVVDPYIVRNSIAPAEEFIAAIKRLIDT